MTARPFVDFLKLLDRMAKERRSSAIGNANYKLIKAGLADFSDIVTKTRIRPFREVVARQKLTVDEMVRAGISLAVATHAYQSVHTPAIELMRAHQLELIDRITKAGISREQIAERVGQHYAGRVATVAPSSTTGRLPLSAVRGLISRLTDLVKLLLLGSQLEPSPAKKAAPKG